MLRITYTRILSALCAVLTSGILYAQPASSSEADFNVHHKHVSIVQDSSNYFGHAVALAGDVAVVSDAEGHVEVLRQGGDGSWAFEALLTADMPDIDFGGEQAVATNGTYIAVGAKSDDTFDDNSGAVYLYKYDGLDWQSAGVLDHMNPFGNADSDFFGISVAMDGDHLVVGSKMENGHGAQGCVTYFEYNTLLDMWLEAGVVQSTHTTGGCISLFAGSVDVDGDHMIVGEPRNSENDLDQGAAHIYRFENYCWHHQGTFYGDEQDRLGTDVAISGDRAAAGAPFASGVGNTQGGKVAIYQNLEFSAQNIEFSANTTLWAETHYFQASAVVSWDRFGYSVDLDGDVLAVGAPTDDQMNLNAGLGYFIYDCSAEVLECVSEAFACDAMPDDRFGYSVAVDGGIVLVGTKRDDNIFPDAGSAYFLGAADQGFACDLTGPAAPLVDLLAADDSGVSDSDNITQHNTLNLQALFNLDDPMSDQELTHPGDAIKWWIQGTTDTSIFVLNEVDVEMGHGDVNYFEPPFADGEYTFCSRMVDSYGNQSGDNCLLVIIDNENPVVAVEDFDAYLDENGEVTITADDADNGTTDNVGLDELTLSEYNFDCDDLGPNTVTLTAVDLAGNSVSVDLTVTVIDDESPILSLQDIDLYLDASGAAVTTALAIDNGSTDNCSIVSISISETDFGCSDLSPAGNEIDFTATDQSGNSTTGQATVFVHDTISPTMAAQDITVNLSAAGNVAIAPSDVDNGSFDNCSVALSLDIDAFGCEDVGENTVTLTGTDPSNNSSSTTATVTVVDVTPPAVVSTSFDIYLDANGDASPSIDALGVDWTDACGLLSASGPSFTCADLGVNVTSITVTDVNGNSTTNDVTITVIDTINPVVVGTAFSIDLDATGNATLDLASIALDWTDACGIVTATTVPASFTCSDVNGTLAILTATDASGNSVTAEVTITAVDVTPPAVVSTDLTVTLDATGLAPVSLASLAIDWTDACGLASVSCSDFADFKCENVGVNATSITVTDVNGNSTTSAVNITVVDATAPVAIAQDFDLVLGTDGSATLTGADVDNGSSDACGVTLSVEPADFNCNHTGSNPVTLTVTDPSGNSTTASAVVTVIDDIAPTLVIQDITVELDALGQVTIAACDIDGGTTDPCSATIAIVDTDFTCTDLGENAIAVTATDPSGNVSNGTANVTVVDVISPTAIAADLTVYLDANGAASITTADIDNSSSDNCSFSLALDITSFGCDDTGANTVTLTATDGSGNANSTTAVVTVVDNIDPVATTQNIDLYLDVLGVASISADDIDNGSSDNCGFALSIDLDSFNCLDTGANTVTLTATDDSGNTHSATTTVTVLDTISPVIISQDITVYLDELGGAACAACDLDGGTSDACGALLTLDITDFTCAETGANTITLTAVDPSGNTSTGTATVTVVDSLDPSALAADLTVYLDVNGAASITTADIDAGSSDNCGFTLLLNTYSFDCTNTGANTVVLTIADDSGNTDAATATVTVIDNIAPVAVSQDITVYLAADGTASIVADDIDNGSSDACGVTLALDITDFNCNETGANTVTLTVTDPSGNATDATATATVLDTISPILVAQDLTVYLDEFGGASIAACDLDNGSSDACGADLTIDVTEFTCADTGANTVNLTLTDASGNVTTGTSTVTVIDNTPPTASAADYTVNLDENGAASITTADIDAGSSDNCGFTLLLNTYSFDCTNTGANTVVLTITDDSGNTDFAIATVTVVDAIAPVAVAQDIIVSLDVLGEATITAADIDNGSSDNCTFDLEASVTYFNCNDTGANTVTLTATDASGNVHTATATVTIVDDISPDLNVMDLTVYLDENGAATVAACDIDNGTSDACSVILETDVSDFDCTDTGANTVNVTATDPSGNVSVTTVTITVIDSTNPAIAALDLTVYLDASGAASITTLDIDNGTTDNCDFALSLSVSNFDCSNTGANTVTLTATDDSNNISTADVTVTVIDDIIPTTLVQNIDIYLDVDGDASITPASIDNGSDDNCGFTLTASQLAFDCTHVGANNITLTNTDDSGNTSSAVAVVTVHDNIAPAVTVQDLYFDLCDLEEVTLTPADFITASSDACGIVSEVIDLSHFTCMADHGHNTVTITVTDVNGNITTLTADVHMDCDNTAPSCPTVDLVDAEDLGSSNTDNVTSVDSPDIQVIFTGTDLEAVEAGDEVAFYVDGVLLETATVSEADSSLGYVEFSTGPHADGLTTFTAIHTDMCGYSSTVAYLPVVFETSGPTAVGQDVTLELSDEGTATVTLAQIENGSFDNQPGLQLGLQGEGCNPLDCDPVQSLSFDCSDVGANPVTLQATDLAGNIDTDVVTITVLDNIDPVAVAQNVTLYLDENGDATLEADMIENGSTDNCSVDGNSLDGVEFSSPTTVALDCSNVGTYTQDYYVIDSSGNINMTTAEVTVIDEVAPNAIAQNVTIQLDENGAASTTVDAVNNGSNDACGVASVTLSQTAFECGELGEHTVTLTVTDVNGNVSTATATVTVEDLIDPVATMYAPADFIIYAGASCVNGADLYEAGSPWYEATDNCENDLEVEIAYAEVNDNGGTAGCREFDRRWIITVTDAAGNTGADTAYQHITISDVTAPVVSLEQPADVTLNLDADCSVELPDALSLAASATDNCTASPAMSAVTMVDDVATPLCEGGAGSYSILRTYSVTATDACGNATTTTVEMTITVNDVMAPQITDAEGMTNGQQVDHDADAGGILDFATMPDAVTVQADDFCDPTVDVSLTQIPSGAVPTDEIANYCAPSTPDAASGNMACTGTAPNAIVLEGAFFGGEAFNIDDAGVNSIEVGYDEHLDITLTVTNGDNTGGFVWTARYNPAWTWSEWAAEARSYKKDCADIMAGEMPWEDWSYFIMSNGSMSGTGVYAGSNLTMTHQPLNYYYGFQVGAGANNQNANYGASAWFYWSGEIVVDGVSQGQQASSGDVAMDLDCALPWSIENQYTTSDDCGNSTVFTYTDAGTGEVTGDGGLVSGGQGHTPYEITTGASGLKDPIRITGLMPNPTTDVATLGFVVVENMRIRIDLYTMSGVLVQELFDGTAGSNQQYLLDIDASGLGSGMYQIRISSSSYMTVKKLLVTQ